VDVKIAIPDRHVSEGVLNAGLEAVTRVNEALIKEGSAPTFSEAIKRGVRWQPEPPGQESFDHALKVVGRGWGDCDDLAPYRAGSLRASGQDPNAKSVVYKSGPGRWHAIVQRGNGVLEDPSRTAGMAVREGSRAAGIPPAVVGAMGRPSLNGAVRPFVAVRRDNEGYLARVDMAIDGEDAFLSSVQHGRSPSQALSGCMAGACMIGSASGMVENEALDKMWAVHGLMKGQSLKEVAQICGPNAAKDALLTLKQIAPDLVEELRKHWKDARTLREDFDRMQGRPTAGAAVPFVAGRHGRHHHPKKHHHHHHYVRGDDGGPGVVQMGPPQWSDHLLHERVVSPYAERYGTRGRQFVGHAAEVIGAATSSPYLEMRMQQRTWGVPRAFGHEQAFNDEPPIAQVGWGEPGAIHIDPDAAQWSDHLAHERVISPFAERFGHRGRQFVGGAGLGAGLPFRPTLSFSLAGDLQAEADELVARLLAKVPPADLATANPQDIAKAILSALRAAPLGRPRGRITPASQIVGHGDVGAAFNRALHARTVPVVGIRRDRKGGERRSTWLHAGQRLSKGQTMTDPSGHAKLSLQSNGDLTLTTDGKQRWGVHGGARAASLYMNPNGNLQLVDAGGAEVWSTHTDSPQAGLALQDDGNLVIYDPQEYVQWASNTDVLQQGWDLFKDVVQPAMHTAQQYGVNVDNALKTLGNVATTVLSGVQGVISLIPGIGTGISSAISAGLALLSGGSPLEIAVKAAYGAIPIPLGLRQLTDIVVDAALALTHTANLADGAIAAARKAILEKLPAVAKEIGGTVFDTLAHLVLGNVHNAPTHAVVTPAPAPGFPPKVATISTPAHYAVIAKVASAQAAKKVTNLKGIMPVHAAAAAPKPAVVPVRAMAPVRQAPIAAKPMSLAIIVQAYQPQIIRHQVAIPKGVHA
jgi:hypothetical protein